jgi:hypothetical protein
MSDERPHLDIISHGRSIRKGNRACAEFNKESLGRLKEKDGGKVLYEVGEEEV